MAGIIIVALSISYFFVIFLPHKEDMRIKEAMRTKELKLSDSLNKDDKGQAVDYISPTSQIIDTTSEQPILDTSDTGQTNQQSENTYNANTNTEQTQNDLAKEKKKVDEEYRKQQASVNEAQLARDKEAYNTALEKLTRDYNHAVDALKSKEASEGGRAISSDDCGGAGVQVQECAIADRIHRKYQIEYDYLEATYKSDIKAVEATKYW